LFGLALEQIWRLQNKTSAVRTYQRELAALERECDGLETFMKKKEKYCAGKVKALLFDKYLTQILNQQNHVRPITDFFGRR
jgi:hypothetical protein